MKYFSTILHLILVAVFMVGLSTAGHSTKAGKKNCPPDANIVVTGITCPAAFPVGISCYFGSTVPVNRGFGANGSATAVSNTGNTLTSIQLTDGTNFGGMNVGDLPITVKTKCPGRCYQVSITTNTGGCSTITVTEVAC